ncbi:hypothetical protein [Cupriavidus pampae]|uniref:Tox-REase-2 domain-containing protein n=1 Tax=Cupriavidus pampae TaxID=659251 RepID=A0ABM8Y145_9BURK|nr:hypothetical protein [Cupriavidus pampae]CAG9186457.1 hypothetical protein LMG32289_06436 [Cupriavidus pampae]
MKTYKSRTLAQHAPASNTQAGGAPKEHSTGPTAWIADSPRMVAQRQRLQSLGPGVIQGYFTHQGMQLNWAQKDAALGWANASIGGVVRQRFNQTMSDNVNPTDLGGWLISNGLQQTANTVLAHTGYQEMVDQSLMKSEILFHSEVTQEDYGDIPGMDRFEQDVSDVRYGRPDSWQFLQGYKFQMGEIASEHGNPNGPGIVGVEMPYQGVSGSNRRADIELNGNIYVETKAMQTSYNPPQLVKEQFRSQASDYAQSGKQVIYRFSNNPPQWVQAILAHFHLNYEVV